MLQAIDNALVGFFILYMIIAGPTIVYNLWKVWDRWCERRTQREFQRFLAERGWDKDYDGPNYLHRSPSERAEQETEHPRDP
jgi:hypothetical protein